MASLIPISIVIGSLGGLVEVQAQEGRTMETASTTASKYLLLDSRIVERASGVRLTLGHVEKDPHNPFFVEDKPWEVRFDNLYANVLFDEAEQVYKVWYSPFIIDEVTSSTPPAERERVPYKPGKREMGICYAISKDGIRWEKPNLGVIEFNGSMQNNLVMRHVHGAGVWKDPRDPDPQRRYKVFAQGGAATSPDGLRWSPVRPCPEIEAAGDTHNNAFWFGERQRYVGITRLWADGQRIVGRTESADYRTWTKAVEVLRGDPGHQTYAMPVFRYANVWLGLAMIYDTGHDTVDCELTWSPDTIHWERVCAGTPLIPRGPEGAFDSGCIYAAAYPVIRPGEIRLYYGGNNGPHSGWRAGGFGLARLRPDGFAGMEATVTGGVGEVTTTPIPCSGGQLRVSADAAGGSLRVAVLDAEGLDLDHCRPITRDVTDAAVAWNGGHDLAHFAGKPIQLRFELRSATLYAFGFTD